MTYAIFSIGSRQFRAEPGVTLKLPKLEAEPGSKVTFDRVLLASDGKQVHAGSSLVKQGGTKFHPGLNGRRGSDDTLFTVVDGQVKFEHKNKKRYKVSVYPVAAN